MRVDVSGTVEERLRKLAASRDCDVDALVMEALRQYVEAAAITDLDAAEVAAGQAELLKELPRLEPWKSPGP